MGLPLNHPAILQAIERGLIDGDRPTPAAGGKRPGLRVELVKSAFTTPATWVIPVVTTSEINGRDWRSRSNRTKAAREAVSKAFGPRLMAAAVVAHHYHQGGAVRAVFTRLGGRRIDLSNLGSALKGCEDAVCLIIGASDGDPRWRPEFRQEPGGPVGVRVELERI